MPIAFDRAENSDFIQSGSNAFYFGDTPLTFVFEVSAGTGRKLVVSTQCVQGSVSGVTCNGSAMTLVGGVTHPRGSYPDRSDLWYFDSPLVGDNTVVISFSAGTYVSLFQAAAYSGMDAGLLASSTPAYDDTQTPTSPANNVAVTGTGAWLVGMAFCDKESNSVVAGANTTVRSSSHNYSIGLGDSGGPVAAGARTLQYAWSQPGNAGWRGLITAAFAPLAGPAPVITGPTGAVGAASITVSAAENQATAGTWTASDSAGWELSGTDAVALAISVGGVVTKASGTFDFDTKSSYSFSVVNGAVTQAVTLNITDEGAPTGPTIGDATSITGTSFSIPWTDNSSTETSFRLEIESPSGAGNWALATATTANPTAANVTSLAFTGQTPATSRRARVRASSTEGDSAWSVGNAFTTDNVASGGGSLTDSPVVTGATGTGGTLSATGACSVNQTGTLFFKADASATATDPGAGNEAAAGWLNQTITATGAQSVNFGVQTAGTRYGHFFAVNTTTGRGSVANSASFTVTSTSDTTPPTLSGPIAITSLTSTGYVATCPTATDDTAVTGYQWRLNGGSYTDIAAGGRSVVISGRTPATTDTLQMRAGDAAGNFSTALSASIDLPASSIITPPPPSLRGPGRLNIALKAPPLPARATTPPLLGVHTFQGHSDLAFWDRVAVNKRPLKGIYVNTDPAVVNLQLTEMRDFGFDFVNSCFFCDGAGAPVNMQWLDNYKNNNLPGKPRVMFMWDNTNAVMTANSWNALTTYWANSWTSRSDFLRINGRPLVVVYRPEDLKAQAGGGTDAGSRALLDAARAKTNFFFLANTTATVVPTGDGSAEAMGYDGTTAYNIIVGTNWSELSAANQRYRQFRMLTGNLPFMIQGNTGWNDTVRYSLITDPQDPNFQGGTFISDPSAAEFEAGARETKAWHDFNPAKSLGVCWNAWDEDHEGSVIQPRVDIGNERGLILKRVFGK